MDPLGVFQIIIIIILIALSAFFSSAETAYTKVSKIKLRSLCDQGNKRAIQVTQILDNPSRMLSGILVGNNIVNIGVTSLTTTFAIKYFGGAAAGISTAILTVVLLIFGEITPKTLASTKPEEVSMLYAPVIRAIILVLTPVVFVIDKLSGWILKLFKIDSSKPTATITEAELKALVDVSHEEGVLESDEKKIIHNLFEFGDSVAKDVMVPRIDVDFISQDADFDEVMDMFKESSHSRIPVYKDNPDNIVGVLYSKDLLLSGPFTDASRKNSFDIARLMRKPYFTFETQNISVLFKDMQKCATSSAIVLDEYGSVAGFITTQDLIEEIIGEIRDEYDLETDRPFTKISDTRYRIDGSYKLDDINDALGTHLESDDNDSIGGLIIEQLDRFPRAGDSIERDGVKVTVMRVNNKRVDTVMLDLPEEE